MDTDLKKRVLRKLTYGMWVLASGEGDDLEASSVTWLMQVSFTPPLVAVAIKAGSHLTEVVERHRAFTLHLLSQAQQDLASAFIKPTQITPGKIGGIAWQRAQVTGMPLLEGFPAWLEARVVEVVTKGDHAVFIAEIVGVGATDADAEPFTLAQAGWNYGG
jgi:flavin reductase (DIM6/NTAB) family NADH-FMN oxidoreductase RutF